MRPQTARLQWADSDDHEALPSCHEEKPSCGTLQTSTLLCGCEVRGLRDWFLNFSSLFSHALACSHHTEVNMNSPVILITGAGKGIGKAVVEEVLDRAAQNSTFKPRLVLTSRTKSDLVALQKLV